MAKIDQVLHLRIEQDGKVHHRYLRGNTAFYIGKSAKNDVVLIGDHFPKRHPLFIRKGKHYKIQLPGHADGEILAKKSRLRLSDLIEHELLPRGKAGYEVEIKPGRMGYIFLDSTRIDFVFETRQITEYRFDAYSPLRVFLKSLKEDALFKGVVTILLLLNAGVLYALKDYVPAPKKPLLLNRPRKGWQNLS